MENTPTPAVGSYVLLDGRCIGENLLPGDNFSDSGYPGCDFRYPSATIGGSVAVNVKVTGRTLQRKNGANFVRCRIEWVGDCCPSTFSSGWLLVK
jgi:hypothetical protein